MFIRTKREAQEAARIAHNYGFTRLSADDFHRRYTVNVFGPWSSDQDARSAQAEIADFISYDREIKRRPTRAEIEAEDRAERILVAHNISARTGERFNDVLKRIA